jgi:hypothetical protein
VIEPNQDVRWVKEDRRIGVHTFIIVKIRLEGIASMLQKVLFLREAIDVGVDEQGHRDRAAAAFGSKAGSVKGWAWR